MWGILFYLNFAKHCCFFNQLHIAKDKTQNTQHKNIDRYQLMLQISDGSRNND